MKHKWLLIVEDEAINAMMMRQVMQDEYLKVDVVSTGEDAVRLVREQGDPDLIVMDIRLAGVLNGIDAIREIQSGKKVPHVYCTAFANPEILSQAWETHPLSILQKPINPVDLVHLLG